MILWRPKVAFLTAAALVISAPGLPCYEAAAQVVRSVPSGAGVVSGASAISGAAVSGQSRVLDAGLSPLSPALNLTLQPGISPTLQILEIAPAQAIESPSVSAETVEAAAASPAAALLAADHEAVSQKLSSLPASQAKGTAAEIMDLALGVKTVSKAADDASVAGASGLKSAPGLRPSGAAPSETGSARGVPGAGLGKNQGGGGPGGGKWDRFKNTVVKLWNNLTGILSDKVHNKQFWVFITGQAIVVFGAAFFHTALAGLVVGAAMGYIRGINWAAQAASSFSTGPLIDKVSANKIFAWTYLSRAVFMIAAAPLFITGHYFFGALAVIIAVTSFLQSMSLNAGSSVITRILGGDKANYNKANGVYNLWLDGFGMVGNLAAMSFIAWVGSHAAWLTAHLGASFAVPLLGSYLCFPVYGLMMAAMVLWYRLFLSVPRNEFVEAQRGLAEVLKSRQKSLLGLVLAVAGLLLTHLPREGWRQAREKIAHYRSLPDTGPKITGVAISEVDDKKTLVIEVEGDPAALTDAPKEFDGFPVIVAAKRKLIKELKEGLTLVAKDRYLKLTTLFSTAYILAADAILFTGIPTFIRGMLDITGEAEVSQASAYLGTYIHAGLAVATVGILLYDWLARKRAAARAFKAEPGPASGLDSMERQGRWASILMGGGMLLYWVAFFAPNIWIAALAFLAINFSVGPASVVWASLTYRVVGDRYPQDMGKIYSAVYFYQLIWQIIGVLSFSALAAMASPAIVLTAFCVILSLAALADFVLPFLVLPLSRKSPKP